MKKSSWSELMISQASDEDYVWEIFHQNSKTQRYGHYMADEQVAQRMLRMADSLSYDGYPQVLLPDPMKGMDVSLTDALVNRVTPARLEPKALSLDQLSSILYAGYGVTRTNESNDFLRPFRTAPSGGALYPLELYVSSKHVNGLDAGLYHYNPPGHRLEQLRTGDLALELSEALVEFQANIAFDASMVIMITAIFERSTFKYGARGYRFVMLEAGHVAQNINLAVSGMGLGGFNIGGFYDATMDEILGLDGLTQSTVYLVAIGGLAEVHEAPSLNRRK